MVRYENEILSAYVVKKFNDLVLPSGDKIIVEYLNEEFLRNFFLLNTTLNSTLNLTGQNTNNYPVSNLTDSNNNLLPINTNNEMQKAYQADDNKSNYTDSSCLEDYKPLSSSTLFLNSIYKSNEIITNQVSW